MTTHRAQGADLYEQRPDCARQDCNLRYACEECRPKEWRHVEFCEDWIEIGATSDYALAWRMDIVSAEAWMQVSVEYWEAHDFLELGLQADGATWWVDRGVGGSQLLDAVCQLNCCDVTEEIALNRIEQWVAAGQPLDERTMSFLKAGIAIHDADLFDVETLNLETAWVACPHLRF